MLESNDDLKKKETNYSLFLFFYFFIYKST